MPKQTPPPADEPTETGVDDPSLTTLADPEPDEVAVGPGPDYVPGDDPLEAKSDVLKVKENSIFVSPAAVALPEPSRISENPASTVHYYEVNPSLTVKTWVLHDRPDLWNVTVIRPDGKARTDIPQVPTGYRYDIDASSKDALLAELHKLATP